MSIPRPLLSATAVVHTVPRMRRSSTRCGRTTKPVARRILQTYAPRCSTWRCRCSEDAEVLLRLARRRPDRIGTHLVRVELQPGRGICLADTGSRGHWSVGHSGRARGVCRRRGPGAQRDRGLTDRRMTRRIEIRVTDNDYKVVHSAADASGVTLAEFCRRAARERADEVLADSATIVLDDRDAARFVAAIENPDRFKTGLRRLTARPSVLPPSGCDS